MIEPNERQSTPENPAPARQLNSSTLLIGVVVFIVLLTLISGQSFSRIVPMLVFLGGGLFLWRMTFVSRVQRRALHALNTGDVELALAQTTATPLFGGTYGRKQLLELRQLILLSVGRYADAVAVQPEIVAAAAAMNPPQAADSTAYAYALAGVGRAADALTALSTLERDEPDNPQLVIALADILLDYAPEIDAARADAILSRFDDLRDQRFRGFVPADSIDYLVRRAWMLAHTGRDAEARSLLSTQEPHIDGLGTLHKAAVSYWLGRAYTALGDADVAQRNFSQAATLDPSGAWGQRAQRFLR